MKSLVIFLVTAAALTVGGCNTITIPGIGQFPAAKSAEKPTAESAPKPAPTAESAQESEPAPEESEEPQSIGNALLNFIWESAPVESEEPESAPEESAPEESQPAEPEPTQSQSAQSEEPESAEPTEPTPTPAQLQLAEADSRLHRGIVWEVAPEDEFQNMLNAYAGDDRHFAEATGHSSIRAARPLSFVVIRYGSTAAGAAQSIVLADKKWRLGEGDIVDYYNGKHHPDDLRSGQQPTTAITLEHTIVGFWRLNRAPAARMQAPAQILGIVCRQNEDGCRANDFPNTATGFGRPLAGPADYQGRTAESLQAMENHQSTYPNPFKALRLPFTCGGILFPAPCPE